MKALLVVLLLGGLAPGPTPLPGIPLPGPPAILEPGGPSPTLAQPRTVPPLSTVPAVPEPSGRAPRSSSAAVRPTFAPPSLPATTGTATTGTGSPAPVEKPARSSSPWIGLGAVVVVAGAVAWFVLRRRRHA